MNSRAVFIALLSAGLTVAENDTTSRNKLPEVLNLSSPVIQTLNGAVRGRTIRAGNGRLAQEFLNIPYAQPPVDSLRFRPPQPVKNWSGERDGTRLGNACLQNAGNLAKIFPNSKFDVDVDPSTIDEDCLSVNVYAPYPISNANNNNQTAHKEDGLPVLVWFHGGGFQWGSNNLNLYNASILASEINAIVVIVNYRLNVFGFLTLPGIGITGNQGLLDQALAIKWIRENSRSFGGNPEQITLFGESAGSASVHYHLLSPMSRDLFARGIMQSGSAAASFWSYHTPHQAHQTSREFATTASCDSFDQDASDEFSDQKAFVCLQSKSVEELLADDAKMKQTNKFTLLPTTDGSFLPRSPSDMLQAGDFKRAPIMIGLAANESIWLLAMYFSELVSKVPHVHLSEKEFDSMLLELTPSLSNTTRNAIKFVYRNWAVSTNNEHQMSSERWRMLNTVMDDLFMMNGVVETLDAYAAAKVPVYRCRFDQISKVWLWGYNFSAALHCDDIPFFFGHPLNPQFGYPKEEVELSRKILGAVSAFALTGDPNDPDAKGKHRLATANIWQPYAENMEYFTFDAPNFGQVQTAREPWRIEFWHRAVPFLEMLQKRGEVSISEGRKPEKLEL